MNEVTIISNWITTESGQRMPAVAVIYPYSWTDVTGTSGVMLSALPVALVAVKLQELTDEQLATIRADTRFLVWTYETYGESGAVDSNNYDTPITAQDVTNIVAWMNALGLDPLPDVFGNLVTQATAAALAGNPLTRGAIEDSVIALLKNPMGSR